MTPKKTLAPGRRDVSLLVLGLAIAVTVLAGYLAKRPDLAGEARPHIPRGTYTFEIVGQGEGMPPLPGAHPSAAWIATVPKWNGQPLAKDQLGVFHTEGHDQSGAPIEFRTAWSGGKHYFMVEPGYGHAIGPIQITASTGRGEGTLQMDPLPDEKPSFGAKAQPIQIPGVRAELVRTGFPRPGKRDANLLEVRLTHQLRDDELLLLRYIGTPLRARTQIRELYRWIGPRGSTPEVITFRFEDLYLDRATAAKFELVRMRSKPVQRRLRFPLREMSGGVLTAVGSDPTWNVSAYRKGDGSGYWVTLDAKPNPTHRELEPIFESGTFRLVSPSRIQGLPATLQVAATFARYDRVRRVPPETSAPNGPEIVCEVSNREFEVVDRCETVIPFRYADLPTTPLERDLTWDVALIDGRLYHRRSN